MNVPHDNCGYGRISRLVLPRFVGACLLGLAVGESRAQQYVGQDGRLFDANPQIGGSRYNYSRPVSPLVGGNPYATGNIGRGFSLRSYSPISSPTAFRASLGSGALSNFTRDSVSVADRANPLGGLAPRYFFDPARTAPTGAYLSGLYDSQPAFPGRGPGDQRTGRSVSANPWGAPAPYGSPPARRAVAGDAWHVPGEHVGVRLNTELSSTIFGVERPRLPGQLSSGALLPRPSYLPELGEDGAGPEWPGAANGVQGPLDLRMWPGSQVQSMTPLDVLRQEDAIRLLTDRGPAALPQPSGIPFAQEGGADLPDATAMMPGVRGLRDTSVMPGHDVFTDMRLALELSQNPSAEWYAEMVEGVGEMASEGSTASVDKQARVAAAAAEFLARVLDAPLQTFAGDGVTASSAELRQAEADMELGRYYDAVRHYERASLLDPINPLPVIGKGHALLAAGEYVSAAVSLINGLERFPEMARFQMDLTVLMGGGEIVDIRRADIMKQLARNEDPQLRFLLGYLEIHAGMSEFGMKSLERASREARPGSLIRRYPDMIRHRETSPLLEPLSDDGQGSAIDESRSSSNESSAAGKETE